MVIEENLLEVHIEVLVVKGLNVCNLLSNISGKGKKAKLLENLGEKYMGILVTFQKF